MATVVHPRAWLERRRARHDADRWISRGHASRYPWRVAELTCAHERKACARSVRSVVRELEGAVVPGATPLRHAALRPQQALLEELEARLLDERPVSAIGMLAVNDLLTSPGSPLFAEGDVEPAVRRVLVALEAR